MSKPEALEPVKAKDDAKEFVESTIANNKVVIFSKTHCPFCKKAKAALGTFLKPEQIHAVELDVRVDIVDIQNALYEKTGARSVPRVFIGGQFIGGGDDTAKKAENGELKALLEEQGLI